MRPSFQLREVYTRAVYTSDLTESSEYKECLKLLGFLSKEELLSKLESVVKIVEASKDPEIKKIKTNLNNHVNAIREASLSTAATSSEIITVEEKLSRMQLKEVCAKSYFLKTVLIYYYPPYLLILALEKYNIFSLIILYCKLKRYSKNPIW